MTHKHTYSIPSADDQNDARCIECGRLQPTTQLAKHTPGPWRVDGEGMQVYKDKQPIAVIRTVFDENGGRVTREANAALIAAAPAMYEELGKCVSLIRALQERLNAHGEMCNFDEEEIASAIAALAQAEGKQ